MLPRSVRSGELAAAMSTSSVEIILSSCDPSLLHTAPILYELGIKRVDHLHGMEVVHARRQRTAKYALESTC